MKTYWVEYQHADWGCVVVAPTARQARVVFAHDAPETDPYNFIGIRARWLRNITPPATVTKPTLYVSCETWNCPAWEYADSCDCCVHGKQKRANMGEEDPE